MHLKNIYSSIKKNILFRLLLGVSPLLSALTGGAYLFQDKLILHPTVSDSVMLTVKPRQPGWGVPWGSNGQYIGKSYEPLEKPIGTLLFYHGNEGSVDDRIFLAEKFTQLGFRTVLVEYPGFGAREGKATVASAVNASLEAATFARSRWPGPMFFAGESFGAGVAAQVAQANGPWSNGVILFTPWHSLSALVDEKTLGLPSHLLLHDSLNTLQALEKYEAAVVLISSAKDSVIPVHHARKLSKALPDAFYLELERANHNNWHRYLTEIDWLAIATYLKSEQPKTLVH